MPPKLHVKMRVGKVEFLESFRTEEWSIFYIDTYVSDEPYVFYHGDPAKPSHNHMGWRRAQGRDQED